MTESLELLTQTLQSDTTSSTSTLSPGEIVLGHFSAIDSHGSPLVTYSHSNYEQRVAISSVPFSHQQLGRQVALLFSQGDLQKPIIIGFIHNALNDLLDNFVISPAEGHPSDITVFENSVNLLGQKAFTENKKEQSENTLKIDGKKIVLEGQEEVVLQCGESSITLTKAGKILIRGKYLVSRSSGVNRILGGSVQVN